MTTWSARGATLAVTTPAQAFVLAGLLRLGTRRPVLVVTPTGGRPRSWPRFGASNETETGVSPGLVFPAWETLPF